MSPKYCKVDDNQSEIVKNLRKLGMTVQSLATIGKGCPDILVGYQGRNYVFEIKDENKTPSQRKLTPDEIKWHETWRGQKAVIKNYKEAQHIIMLDNPPFI